MIWMWQSATAGMASDTSSTFHGNNNMCKVEWSVRNHWNKPCVVPAVRAKLCWNMVVVLSVCELIFPQVKHFILGSLLDYFQKISKYFQNIFRFSNHFQNVFRIFSDFQTIFQCFQKLFQLFQNVSWNFIPPIYPFHQRNWNNEIDPMKQ